MNLPSFSVARTELLSGLTVSLAMVPEAVAFALIAGVSPLVGLYAAVILGLVTSSFGGRPGMISGATGAIAVVIGALVASHGQQYLFAAVILMGLLQGLFAVAKLGKLIRLVPHSVMLGFVNGLAVVIFLAQFGNLEVVSSTGTKSWLPASEIVTMLGLAAVTMVVIYLLPKLTRAVPATLVGIVVVSLLVHFLGWNTRRVGDMGSIAGGFPSFSIPEVPVSWETLKIVFPYSLIMACVGLLESLLTLNLIDTMTDTRGRPNREALAQGVANVLTGFFGGMGGCAMIGQSMINISNGALRRLSGISMSLFLLGFILFGSRLIEAIPLAALMGVMFVVAEKTFEWGSLTALRKIPRSDAIIVVGVTVITILTDLAVAVALGVVFAALVFAWQHAKEIHVRKRIGDQGEKIYELDGTLFFASTAAFQGLFEVQADPDRVVIEFGKARVMDHSALDAIDALADRYELAGKSLTIRHLSPDCLELLTKARSRVEIDVTEDPRYHLAVDELN
ncbi:MAG: SulP family inorganic anion transporter [Fibrobacteria bacterium]|nr:SulP family inorganic anion transporter [Fibrobacteria bacterium]